MHLWRLEGRTVVHSVDKRSPAEAAGISPEDVVLNTGETSATEMDIKDLRDLLKSGDGKEISMTIKCGEEEKAVTFKLKKQI
jgi:C-terminal processing protease CtpA/Prc